MCVFVAVCSDSEALSRDHKLSVLTLELSVLTLKLSILVLRLNKNCRQHLHRLDGNISNIMIVYRS